MKRRNQLLVIGTLFLVICGLFGLTYNSTRIITERTVERYQQGIAEETAKTVALWLKQHMSIIDATAMALGEIHVYENPQTLRILQMAIRAGNFTDVYIGLTCGLIVDGTGWIPPAGYDPRIRPWYKKAVDAGSISFTSPYIDLTTMKMVIAVTRPLYSDNRFIGVLSSDIILDTLKRNLLDARIGRSGFSFIIDQHGTILVHPDADLEMNTKFQDLNPTLEGVLTHFEKSSTGSYQYREAGDEMILSYQKLSDSQWYLCTVVQKKEAYALAKNTAMLFAMDVVFKILGVLGLLTLLAVGGSLFAMILSKRHLKSVLRKHQQILSGKERDLKGEIIRRKEIETRYQTIFNVASNGILLSRDNRFVECNGKAAEIFGLEIENVLGKSMLSLSPSHQHDGRLSRSKLREIVRRLRSGNQIEFKWIFLKSNGTQFPAEVTLKRLHLDSAVVMLFSIWDISKRENAERQLMQAQKMAAIGEMISAIAHQWRQPLNALATYIASLLPAFYNEMITKEFLGKLVRESESQIEFMSATINDFREYFKPSKNKAPFYVEETVESAVKLMRSQLRHRNVSLNIDWKINFDDPNKTSPADPLFMRGEGENTARRVNSNIAIGKPNGIVNGKRVGSSKDGKGERKLPVFGYKNEFVHVLVNILSNAMDAMGEREKSDGTVTVEKRIDVIFSHDNQMAVLTIRDSGTGIPPHLVEKIFEPYFTTKGTATGTGIGLYMAKMIVEKEMKGCINAKNLWPDGACFTIRLPLWKEDG